MQNEGELTTNYFGYQYTDEDTLVEMCEYHVDDAERFPVMVQLTELGAQFGGLLSKRIGEKNTVIIIGQDEAVTHEKSMNPCSWSGSGGQQVMRPKSLGMSFHYSAFTSRQFHEWNPQPTSEQLTRINDNRIGSSYVAVDAANKVNGKATKENLKMENLGFVR